MFIFCLVFQVIVAGGDTSIVNNYGDTALDVISIEAADFFEGT